MNEPGVNHTATPLDQQPIVSLRLVELQIKAGDSTLISDTNVTIAAGKITVIVGASGTGKSVLLRTLAGLLPSDGEVISWSGKILIGSDDASEDAEPQRKSWFNRRRNTTKRVGIVFQQFALFDELSATANVQFAIDHRNRFADRPPSTARQWLDELGVPSAVPVSGLSGGQKQRLAIARTLAAEPDVLLYDEPTSGLDSASGQKVAQLIRHTQTIHQRTSIVVTHDYSTLLPIADDVLLLDSHAKRLVSVPREDWNKVSQQMRPAAQHEDNDRAKLPASKRRSFINMAIRGVDDFLSATGSVLWTVICLPIELRPFFPRVRWGVRFTLHYLRLVGGPSAWLYLTLAGLIIGFTGTYFTFRFLPFRLYTQPLLIDELLASIGFALYRILVPVLATVLIAARCGAAVAADVGVKRYGSQVDALSTLGIAPRSYLLLPIVIAFILATPFLEWLCFSAAKSISLITFTSTHPSIGPNFWQQHFYRNLVQPESHLFAGWGWVLLKNILCGIGTASISYYRGMIPKESAGDVSAAITSTVLWTTLYVLIVHFVIALWEF